MESNTTSNKYAEQQKLTNYKETTAMDLYISVKSQDYSAKWDEINKCAICMCELFDDIGVEQNAQSDPGAVHKEIMGKLRENQH